jgi:tRNA(Ile)-lysidine synthetase, C-terminal domain
VARSAKHCADAQVLVEEVADALFSAVFNPADNTLSISRLMEHHVHQQQLIIRHWFRHRGLKMPAQAQVRRILAEVVQASGQRDPVLSGQGYSIRRYRDKLYCLANSPLSVEPQQDTVWPVGQASITTACGQTLSYIIASSGIALEQWLSAKVELRFRRGGEKISLPGRQGRHSLKNLFQEAGIPSWQRDAIPLIYLDGTLAAVGELWVSAAFYTEMAQGCIRFRLQHE